MLISTSRFGPLELHEDEIIHFPSGILGFEQFGSYALLEYRKDSWFRFLQSVDDPDLVFVVIDPRGFRPTYQVEVEGSAVLELGSTDISDVEVYAIVSIPKDTSEMTANLQAPILISRKNRQGQQLVLTDGKYKIQHKIMTEMKQLQGEDRKIG